MKRRMVFGMKNLFIAILSPVLLFGVCWAGEDLELKDEKVRLSYSIGYQVGGDFKRQGMSIRPEVLLKGVQDALTRNDPLMTQQEMRITLMEHQKTIAAAERQKRKEQAEQNRSEGLAFLAHNAKMEGVKTLPSGLQYKVIKEGSGSMPKAKDTVSVHYRGSLIDGTEFDNSFSRGKPASFRLDRVIKGWTEALQLMKTGSHWKMFIPAELAYGKRGSARIPPNSTLIFEVELISIQPAKTSGPDPHN